MAQSFFFYDLETSGLDPRQSRIMQFAGIRTDMELNTVGEPYNILVKLSDDTIPSPEALMVTGISPQQTLEDGYSEAEFARMFVEDIATPDTIMVGFNNIHFDDEFVRYHLWRSFHDPYEWCWRDGRSRWDLLDVVRMTRALRPEGIEWPVVDGKASNRLELLTKLNKIDHFKAHDALSDVEATIAVTKLIKQKQPQLFQYLLDMRDKNKVKKLVTVDDKKPFVYTNGRYSSDFEKTSVAFPLTLGKNGNVVVYDLRYDPTDLLSLSSNELGKKLYATRDERLKDGFVPLPVQEIHYNKAPAVAPLGVLEQADGWKRLQLSKEIIEKHRNILLSAPHFAENVRSLFENRAEFKKSPDAEAQLYDGFVQDRDKLRIETVRNADERRLADFHPEFSDERLAPLLLHYKARNYPSSMSEDEAHTWEQWRSEHVRSQIPQFMTSFQKLSTTDLDENKQFILQELQLWVESIMPVETTDQDTDQS